MSSEQEARVGLMLRQNLIMTGLVTGIMVSLGFALMLAGIFGIAVEEREVGFAGMASGISFLGLAAHIIPRA